jgi:ABC-2 type transport system ATP-binding protein
MDALHIQNLVKKYKEKTAVNDISFSVKKGEFFGFLGPNGAGKTTTINCITGISNITEGVVKLFDIDVVKNYREARKKVGLSPQEFNVDIFSKTWKILDYMGGYYGMSKGERMSRISELLKQFELESHKEKSFRELSGGLKRRVMLARAMVHNPDLLILDEPTAGVDVNLRKVLWEDLRRLNREGKTIFLTSHYLEEVEELCNRIVIINGGKIIADAPKEEFIKNGGKLERRYLELTKNEAS